MYGMYDEVTAKFELSSDLPLYSTGTVDVCEKERGWVWRVYPVLGVVEYARGWKKK